MERLSVKAVSICSLAVLGCAAVFAEDLGPAVEGESLPGPTVEGLIALDVTDVLGRELPARMELEGEGPGPRTVVEAPEGAVTVVRAVGRYRAYVHVYDRGVAVLVDVQEVTVKEGDTSFVLVTLLEGSGGNRFLRAFDRDYDLAIDRVELEAGTDPGDAGSIPGEVAYDWKSPVLSREARWYRGELHAHSKYGIGEERVRELVRRAERLKLDFLAITDRNTLSAALDPEFRSESVVLIPALEWGNDAMGVALVYGPRTFPRMTESAAEAQAFSIRVQAQGGVFAIAHPCFSRAPWQWGLSYVNAVEAWCRDWREVPPMWLDRLDEPLRERRDGRLVHSIAIAAASQGRSANGQGAVFWDLELTRGLKASVIGGSYSASRKVAMGSPVTYVFAYEKSLNGVLDGLRRGRTFVSRDLKGPLINFTVDILDDGTIDSGIGGVVPLNSPSRFFVEVERAKGRRLEVLLNGLPIRSTRIESDELTYSFLHVPESYAVYRVRVVAAATKPAFGYLEMLAMTSPIYAQHVVMVDPEGGANAWVTIKSRYFDPSAGDPFLPEAPEESQIEPNWRM